MPYYTALPNDWQAELEKKTGAKPIVEVLYDPDGNNISLSGKYDIVSITPISNIREMDIDWFNMPIIQDIQITFHDPDNYFNCTNPNSPFYNCVGKLDRDHSTGETSIKIYGDEGVYFVANKKLIINDGTHEEIICPDSFTEASGSTYYHELTYLAGLSHSYKKGTDIYTPSIEKKEILVRMRMTGCASKVTIFRGQILKFPECYNGKAVLTAVDFQKFAFDF